MGKMEDLTAKLMAMAQEFKQIQLTIAAKNSNAKVTFTKEEAQEINAKVNKFDGIKNKTQLDEAGKTLAEELKILIPAFLAKYVTASESQQKQLAGVKAKAEIAANFLMNLGNIFRTSAGEGIAMERDMEEPTLKDLVKSIEKDYAAAESLFLEKSKTPPLTIEDIEKLISMFEVAQKNAEKLLTDRQDELKAQKLDIILKNIKSGSALYNTNLTHLKNNLSKVKTADELFKEFLKIIEPSESLLKEPVYNADAFNKLIFDVKFWYKANFAAIDKAPLYKDNIDSKIKALEEAIEKKKSATPSDVPGIAPYVYNLPFVLKQISKGQEQEIFSYIIAYTFTNKTINQQSFWAVTNVELRGGATNLISAKNLGSFELIQNQQTYKLVGESSGAEVTIRLKRDGKTVPIFNARGLLTWINVNNTPHQPGTFFRLPSGVDIRVEDLDQLFVDAIKGKCDVTMKINLSIEAKDGVHTVSVKVPDNSVIAPLNFKKAVTYSSDITNQKSKVETELKTKFDKK